MLRSTQPRRHPFIARFNALLGLKVTTLLALMVIGRCSGLEVVGEVSDGRAAVQAARRDLPDVVLMDVAMPGMDGIDATREIVFSSPTCRVLGISEHSARGFVSAMMVAGASGYLLKHNAVDELEEALRTVAAGGTFMGIGLHE